MGSISQLAIVLEIQLTSIPRSNPYLCSLEESKMRQSKYLLLNFLIGVLLTILLPANPAFAQSTEEINSFLKTTDFILLLIMGVSAAIRAFSASISGFKLVAKGNPVFQSLLYPLSISLLAVIITIAGGLILKEWNFAFTCIIAANGGIFLVDLLIAIHRFHSSSN